MTRRRRLLGWPAVLIAVAGLAACSSDGSSHSAPKLTTQQAVRRLASTRLCAHRPRALGASVRCFGKSTSTSEVVADIEVYADRRALARARRRNLTRACRIGRKYRRLIVGENFLAFSPLHTKRVAEVLDGRVIRPEHCTAIASGLSASSPALQQWCHELERVYKDEALTAQGPLVDDAVKLIDKLNTIIHTGTGVAKMRDDALTGPASAAAAIDALHRGGLCNGHARPAIVAFG